VLDEVFEHGEAHPSGADDADAFLGLVCHEMGPLMFMS
jgi:hypothetical protein